MWLDFLQQKSLIVFHCILINRVGQRLSNARVFKQPLRWPSRLHWAEVGRTLCQWARQEGKLKVLPAVERDKCQKGVNDIVMRLCRPV